MITPEQLAEWQRLADAATPGLWYTDREYVRDDESLTVVCCIGVKTSPLEDMRNAAFVAAARVAVPALIAEVYRLQEVVLQVGRE